MKENRIIVLSLLLKLSLKIKIWKITLMNHFDICLFILAELVQFQLHFFDNRLHNFYIIILRYFNDVNVKKILPGTPRIRNSLLAEYFPLTYDLNKFKSRAINRPFYFGADFMFLTFSSLFSPFFI